MRKGNRNSVYLWWGGGGGERKRDRRGTGRTGREKGDWQRDGIEKRAGTRRKATGGWGAGGGGGSRTLQMVSQ